MSLVLVNNGRTTLANQLRTYFNANTYLKLFQNNHTPVRGDTAASYTEATFGGYAQITLNSWGAASLTADFHALLTEIVRTFVCTGAPFTNTIYGYYIVDGGGNLLWAELAPASFNVDAINKAYSVIPQFTLTSEFGA